MLLRKVFLSLSAAVFLSVACTGLFTDESVFAYGQPTQGKSATQFQLPVSADPNATYAVFTRMQLTRPEDGTTIMSFVVNSAERAGSVFTLRQERCDLGDTDIVGGWLAFRTGIYSYVGENIPQYIMSGIGTADLGGALNVDLTYPPDPQLTLFTNDAVVLAQIQNYPSTETLRMGVFLADTPIASSLTLRVWSSENTIPNGLRIGYLIMTPGSYAEFNGNIELTASRETLRAAKNPINVSSLRCGSTSIYGIPQASDTRRALFLEEAGTTAFELSMGVLGNNLPQWIIGSQAGCGNITEALAGVAHLLKLENNKACAFKSNLQMQLDVMNVSIVTPAPPAEIETSLTMLWLSIGAVVCVGLIALALYFLCYRKSPTLEPPQNTDLWQTGRPPFARPTTPQVQLSSAYR